MYFIIEIGQRWKRIIGASLTVALLSAVAVVGITLFGSEVLAAWKTPGEAEQALSSNGAFAGLLNFSAPAATAVRFAAQTDEVERRKAQASNGPAIVKNWRYTQGFLMDAFTQSQQLYQQSLLLQALVNFIESSPNVPAFSKNVWRSFEAAWLQAASVLQALDNGLLLAFNMPAPPPITPASPSF